MVSVIAVVACGGSDDPGMDVDAGPFVDDRPIELNGACAEDQRSGRFRLEVSGGTSASSSIHGEVTDKVNPARARVLVAEEGACRLEQRLNPLCDPGCSNDEVCTINNVCTTAARTLDLGPIRLGGLATNIEMKARSPGNNYFDTTIAHPAIMGGEELRLRTTTGDLALDGLGSESLVISGGDWAITKGQPLIVSWEAPTVSAVKTQVGLTLSIDQHGTSPYLLICEFADTGSAEVATTLIDSLFDAGVSGFPNARLERRTSDSQTYKERCVDFQVAHPRLHNASVTGHTPCNGPNDCPDGQTCDLGTNTCVAQQ